MKQKWNADFIKIYIHIKVSLCQFQNSFSKVVLLELQVLIIIKVFIIWLKLANYILILTFVLDTFLNRKYHYLNNGSLMNGDFFCSLKKAAEYYNFSIRVEPICYFIYYTFPTLLQSQLVKSNLAKTKSQQQDELGFGFRWRFTVSVWINCSDLSSEARTRLTASSKAAATLVASFALVSK